MRLGIAGSGAIATGLARVAGEAGDVMLRARSEGSAERARDKLDGVGEVVTDLSELAECEVVIEAVAEDMTVKSELLSEIGAVLPPDALLASTTSSLSVAGLGRASGRPDRFAGLHVFNPVERMKLIELAFPDEAGSEIRARFRDLCEHLGKTAVEVPDSPGFVVNRLLFPFLFDAVRYLESSGLEPEAVDTCMKLGAGHPMGPLALLDFVGLDVSAAIGEQIGVEVPERVRELVAEGMLGKKSGGGFFSY